MKQFVILFVAISVIMVLGFGSPGWSEDTPRTIHEVTLTAAGSGVNLGITRLLAQAFTHQNPTITIDIPGSIGTQGAIKAITDGAIELGLTSRPLKEEEKKTPIVEHPYARVAMIIGAHSGVPDDGISTRELIDIFKGTKTQWKNGNPIIVQSREKHDSGFMILQNAIPGFKEAYSESHAAKRWMLYYTDQDANRALSSTSNAIGVTDLGMVFTEQLKVKALKLDGIAPDPENVMNGKYPLSRTLFFLYRSDSISDAVRQFLAFTATEAGKTILKANGYIPLP